MPQNDALIPLHPVEAWYYAGGPQPELQNPLRSKERVLDILQLHEFQ